MNTLNTLVKPLFCAAALASVSLAAHSAGIPGQGTWETTLQARDINHDGAVDAYYDSTLNISWLANMNAGAGSAFDNGSNTSDGRMTWDNAVAWADSLTQAGGGWRLPSFTPLDVGVPTTYPFGPFGPRLVDRARGELPHMFYVTLGNKGYCPPQTPCGDWLSVSAWGLRNTADFQNLQSGRYWTGESFVPDANQAFFFATFDGLQSASGKNSEWYAVAVHDGDVTTAVPEPEALAMMLAGLAGIGFLVRRRRR